MAGRVPDRGSRGGPAVLRGTEDPLRVEIRQPASHVAPAETAMSATAASGPSGRTIATRSFRPMPRAFRVATVSSTWRIKRPYISGRRPGARIAIALGFRSACSRTKSWKARRPGSASRWRWSLRLSAGRVWRISTTSGALAHIMPSHGIGEYRQNLTWP